MRWWWIAAALSASCGAKHFVAQEPWSTPPAFRVGVLVHGEDRLTLARAGDGPITLDLADNSLSSGGTEVWMFGWTKAELEQTYPGLKDAAPAAIEAALVPTLAADGELPPDPSEVLFAKLDDATSISVNYVAQSFAAAKEKGVRPRLIVAPRSYCGGVAVSTFQSPPGSRFDGVVAPDEASPYFLVSASPYSPTASVSLARWDGADLSRIAAVSTGSVAGKLAFEPGGKTIWTVDRYRLHHFDLNGTQLPVPTLDGRAPLATEVACGRDGTVAALLETRSASGNFVFSPFLLNGSRWETAMRDGRIPDQSFEILDVTSRHRGAAWYNCWIAAFEDPVETSGWHNEFVDFGCNETVPSRRATVRDMSGDDDQYVLVGNRGTVSFRNDATRYWPPESDPISRSPGPGWPSLYVAAAMDDRRALVAGGAGLVELNTHGVWCSIDIGSRGLVYRGAVSPSRRVAYLLVDEGLGQPTRVARVELPATR